MKQYVNNIPGCLTTLLSSSHIYRIVIILSLVTIIPLIFFLKLGTNTQSKTSISENMVTTRQTTTPIISPTKWWIKSTPTYQSIFPTTIASKYTVDGSTRNCLASFSLALQPGTYAYISLTPPLPNRVRTGAGKANAYSGQIQPGNGIKILDGPLCADGFYWWLVESTKTQLQGWTVMGSGSQQWIIPCPNPKTACEKIPVIPQITPTVTSLSTVENIDNRCNSNKFAIGVFAQVAEDNLLVIRSKPYTGSVIGHAGPMSTVKIVDGPACVDSAVWWKVNLASHNLTGWTTEANLRVCTKENDCS